MSLLSYLFPPRGGTAVIAKERLKIVLAHERASRDAPDFLPVLQRELLDVVGRYVQISDDTIRVNVGKSGETSTLEINIEIAGSKLSLTGAKDGKKSAGDPVQPPQKSTPAASAAQESAKPH
ncbi:MAG TPA: cell division topological specificity factor MinE [Stellaceae bacterium]|nr:cell division topological specificity factor MinE [Stellaceae bacterium]